MQPMAEVRKGGDNALSDSTPKDESPHRGDCRCPSQVPAYHQTWESGQPRVLAP